MKRVNVYQNRDSYSHSAEFPIGTTEADIEAYFLKFISENGWNLLEAYWRYA